MSNMDRPGPPGSTGGERGAPGLGSDTEGTAQEHRMVQVFIKDQRRTPSEKLVEVMKLGVIKGDHAGNDPTKPEYRRCILSKEADQDGANISQDPFIVLGSDENENLKIEIFVDNPVFMPLKRPLNGTLQPPAKRHRRMASEVHTAEDLNLKKDATCALNGRVVAWLECQPQANQSTASFC
ncbi:hypothetical protein BJV77DRAFT_1070912 [Russula vinacea]|nr:hypothetical protein BJV77DRAFT_1070912 [Russula vinacea]